MKINKLKKYRIAHQMKQKTLADILGICQSYMSQLESSSKRHRFKISPEIFQKMHELGIKGNPFDEIDIEDGKIRTTLDGKLPRILKYEHAYENKRIFLKDVLHALDIDLVICAAETGRVSFEVFYKKGLIYSEKGDNIHFSSL